MNSYCHFDMKTLKRNEVIRKQINKMQNNWLENLLPNLKQIACFLSESQQLQCLHIQQRLTKTLESLENQITLFQDYLRIIKELNQLSVLSGQYAMQFFCDKDTENSELFYKLRHKLQELIQEIHQKYVNNLFYKDPSFQSLFDGVILTKECINKRFQEISIQFHPEVWDWFESEKAKGQAIIEQAAIIRNSLISKLEEESKVKGEIVCFIEKGLKSIKSNKMETVEYYKAACKAADIQNASKAQGELRLSLSRCCSDMNKIKKAKLFSISALLLAKKSEGLNQKFQKDISELLMQLNSLDNKQVKQLIVSEDDPIEQQENNFFFEIVNFMIRPIGKGISMLKTRSESKKQNKLRDILNLTFEKAIESFQFREFSKFIRILASFEDKITNPNVPLYLFKLQESIDTKTIIAIQIEELILYLINHGFRPDGIAYLLTMIGEALASRTLNFAGLSQEELDRESKRILGSALRNELLEYAALIDSYVENLRTPANPKNLTSYLYSFISSTDTARISREFQRDFCKLPALTRLEEIRNIAKLDLAILTTFEKGEPNIRLAHRAIQEVRKSIIERPQITFMAEKKLKLVQDWYWLISYHCKSEPLIDNSYLYIENPLISTQEKAEYYFRDGQKIFYEGVLQEKKKRNQTALKLWREAEKKFRISLECDPGKLDSSLFLIRALIKLTLYKEALELLRKDGNISGTPESFLLEAKCFRKMNDYLKANNVLQKATLGQNSPFKEAKQERDILGKLRLYTTEDYLKKQKPEILIHSTRNPETENCNILSIDGGGIRGIIPCVLLTEIEKVTKRSISSIFNVMSGTSTGAVIVAGLSVPKLDKTPRFSAHDLLDLYLVEAPQIFQKNTSWLGGKLKSTYTPEGKLKILEEKFKQDMIKDTLSEIVIPVCKLNNQGETHLFTTSGGKYKIGDFKLVDILMATTAAPTFFPQYNIPGIGNCIDGGVVLNNPTRKAYEQAVHLFPKSEKFVLSLGTGCFVKEMGAGEHKMFWAMNIANFTITGQEHDVDDYMYGLLGNERYLRVQTWIDKPIELDSISQDKLGYLVECGRQTVEEMYFDDENYFNKLIERLLK